MRFMIVIVSVLALAGPEASAKRHKNEANEPIQWGAVKQVDLGALPGSTTAPAEAAAAPLPSGIGQILRQEPQSGSSGSTQAKTGPKSELSSPGGTPTSGSKMDGKTEGQEPAMLPKQANLVTTQLGQLSQVNGTYVPGQGNTGTMTTNGQTFQVTEADAALAAQLFGQAKYYENGGVNNRLTQVTGIPAGSLDAKGILAVTYPPGVSLGAIGVNASNKKYYQPTVRVPTQIALQNNDFSVDAGTVFYRPLYRGGRIYAYAPFAGGGDGPQGAAPGGNQPQ